MRYTREYIEMKGRLNARIEGETDFYNKVNVLGNISMYVMKDDKSVAPSLIKDGFWEAWITAWVFNNVDRRHLFVDIGANTGYYSFVAKSLGAQPIAFEPNGQYAQMIRESIMMDWEQSRGDWLPKNHFNVYEWAIADKVGRVTLTVPDELHGSASIRDNAIDESIYPSKHIEVMTTTLDNCLGTAERTKELIIKVDAEGAEEMIWNGAVQVRQNLSPTWMIEYTPGAYGRDFLNNLEAYGDLKWINHVGQEESITKNQILSQADWIMLIVRKR